MMHGTRLRLMALLLTGVLPLCGACESTSSDSSTLAPTPVTTTETFTATIEQLGSTTHAFSVAVAGTVQVKLTAVEPLATMALGVAVTTGGTACGSDIAQNTNS